MTKKLLPFLTSFMILLYPAFVYGELRIEINRGIVEPLPIAVTEFYTAKKSESDLAYKLNDLIETDLENSGLFRPLNHDAFLQSSQALLNYPRFEDWKLINAQALVSGQIEDMGGGRFKVSLNLYDVFAEQRIESINFTDIKDDQWRRVGHKIADAIYHRLTGEQGYFDTQIVYVSETGPATKRVKRLAIMDMDGENHRYIGSGDNLVLTPRFSPNMHKIIYMGYQNRKARLYLLDLKTGMKEVLGDFPGMNFAPRFSPDGNYVLMSFARNGQTQIYEMNLKTRKISQLTNSAGISTGGSYSPDGNQIVFESDRGGSQQIYVMNRDGSNERRITFSQGIYGNPVWSPRGDWIAFTKLYNKRFSVGVMRPDGSGERILTEDFHVEGASWAPNGRNLIFFKERYEGGQRRAKLYQIDLTGYHEKELKTPLDGSDPTWSPIRD